MLSWQVRLGACQSMQLTMPWRAAQSLHCCTGCSAARLSCTTSRWQCAVWLDKSSRADSFLEAEHALLERVRTVEQRSADIKLECEERIRCGARSQVHQV